jgi:glycerophosphoryl diester phosphodiesterase
VCFAWDLQFEHVLRPILRMGIDGVFSDHVDTMVDAFVAELGRV